MTIKCIGKCKFEDMHCVKYDHSTDPQWREECINCGLIRWKKVVDSKTNKVDYEYET